MSEGWALLARGEIAEAAAYASRGLGRFPNSIGVLTLATEAEIARGGSLAALLMYDRWVGVRALEEPGILRRIAQAVLWEKAGGEGRTRLEALRILLAEGDQDAATRLVREADIGAQADARVLAAAGDERGVRALLASLEPGGGSPSLEALKALGRSRHPLAFAPLSKAIGNREPAVRQAAAHALGLLGDRRAIPLLRQVLDDQSGSVRGEAAGALLTLGDASGLEMVNQLASSETPEGRLAAAQYLSSRPDANWLAIVRPLLTATTPPDVRLAAARLLAPYAPNEALDSLRSLGADNSVDLAVREEAVRAQPAAILGDLRTLRDLLREPDDLVQIEVAGRILALTRR